MKELKKNVNLNVKFRVEINSQRCMHTFTMSLSSLIKSPDDADELLVNQN